MAEKDLDRLREKLLESRREIFDRLRQLEADWKELEEREIELEEEAQKMDLAILFDRLDEREKDEVEAIDVALYKMAKSSYGICESCQKPIPLKRLEVLPAARLCLRCARKYEEQQKRLPRARVVITSAEVPSEYRDLSDEELAEAIYEQFRNDGRLDLQELEITCRKGVVFLEGIIPSEAGHQIILQILTDIMGFEGIVDHLQATELIWEREDLASGRAAFDLSVDEDEISDDVLESQEKEISYIFPERPLPEKE